MVEPEADRSLASRDLEAEGYATIPGADRAPSRWPRPAARLEEAMAHTPPGRDDFEGRRTRRVYALFAKTRALDALATHPVVLGVLDRVLGQYQLSAPAAIAIGPGERAQPLHPDDAIYPVARPHRRAGGQRDVAAGGVHRGQRGHHGSCREATAGGTSGPPPRPPTMAIEMPAGTRSALPGQCLARRRGQHHRPDPVWASCSTTPSAWLRPVENHVLAVPPRRLASHPAAALQELLGLQHLSALHRLRRRPAPGQAPGRGRPPGLTRRGLPRWACLPRCGSMPT